MENFLKKSCYFILVACVLNGCRFIDIDFEGDRVLLARVMEQKVDRYPEIDPLQINQEIRVLVDKAVQDEDENEGRLRKLLLLLYGSDGLALRYAPEVTHTAIESFAARQGNCLSVMNLFVAMARYAGIDANFQTVKVRPNWDRRGNLVVLSQHINATGRFGPHRSYVSDFTPEVSLQQFTSTTLTDAQARSLYFTNIGVEALIEGNSEEALDFLKNALFLDPDSSVAWNNIGAIYSDLGNSELTEFSYKMSVLKDSNSMSAIGNLAKFYRKNGQLARAKQYDRAIERFNETNPYFFYSQGSAALSDDDFVLAEELFLKAVSLMRFEPVFYQALSRLYAAKGENERSTDMILIAKNITLQDSQVYEPSSNKMRIIDNSFSILRDSASGISIDFRN
ncbi:MAG: transglutaminase domain-containing protein [Gammaproteobacteria bacterium]|nr:transglutaminase domain-containing protein [Gammaproteobacteria bacterium]MDG2118685.1 transglutaminase domain-containing protein [Gammaproteobacteria bacterium]